MAYISVTEWTPDQVTEWLKGLDDAMFKYVYSFTNNEVGGRKLLNIRPYELEQLGMHSIGHQEIVLEAVEHLRNFHSNLNKENLQFMALQVATSARCLHRELASQSNDSKLKTQTLNDITRTIATIKLLIGWLDRAPFQGQYQFNEISRRMLRLGLEMATIAQRDRFAERPAEQIRTTAEKLDRLANYIIQDITDPMLLQPASLKLVTLRKRESDLGFNIESSYYGIHRITDIKYNSPAHTSGKIEYGDEIVQINYQTVVGWQYKNVIFQLQESVPDVLLTLKKRPAHMKIYGQIYMQPYRLPSKKRTMGNRWGENLPSPRAGFLTAPSSAVKLPLKAAEEKVSVAASSDTDSSCSDILTPTDTKDAEKETRLYYPKPRAMLQRRNTICGDELHDHKYSIGITLWHDRKKNTNGDPSSPSLRDKSVSFGFLLQIAPRPTTCIVLGSDGTGGKFASDMTSAFPDPKPLRPLTEIAAAAIGEKSKPGISKVVRFEENMKIEDYAVDQKFICNVEDTILETFEPILFADEEEDVLEEITERAPKMAASIENTGDNAIRSNSVQFVEALNPAVVARRGRLDKSHSTPAYDITGEEADTPPAIEPRKEFLQLTPPVPPPRPRKPKELMPPQTVPPPPPKPPGLMANLAALEAVNRAAAVVEGVKSGEQKSKPPPPPPTPTDLRKSATSSSINREDSIAEGSEDRNELHTPTKTRTLTLKKKHSLIAKRRNVNLKVLGTGEIQGHLFRRTKNRRGVTFWARLYFVMLDTILYGFRTKEAPKASCVIFLPGFTVSLATEVHSKDNAFKVYHSAKTFYFAAESKDALNQWVDFLRQATLTRSPSNTTIRHDAADVNQKELFSETDSSGEESESVITNNLSTPSPQNAKDITAKILSTAQTASTPASSTKQDRSYLGSLRKLKGSLPFKNSSAEKKASSDIPVPTDQFRTYRKVPGGSFGIQIGTNTPGYHDASQHPYNIQYNLSNTTSATPPPSQTNTDLQRNPSMVSTHSSTASESQPLTVLGPPSSPAPVPKPPTSFPAAIPESSSVAAAAPATVSAVSPDRSQTESQAESPVRSKKIAYNFIHASNPNLVEFEFQTSKTLDYSLPKVNASSSWDVQPNILGSMTLKDLMLLKQEEEAQEMYNNRVFLGVEKKDDGSVVGGGGGSGHQHQPNSQQQQQQQQQHRNDSKSTEDQPAIPEKMSKTQSRSLPKTPDYEISFKPDDEEIKLTRTKEGLKLRDFGYELIHGDEPIGGSGKSRQNSNTTNSSAGAGSESHHHEAIWSTATKTRQFIKSQQYFLSTHKHKKHASSASTSSAVDVTASVGGEKRFGSFKKKSKLEAVKTMTLPLNKKSKGTLDAENRSSIGSGIKKSHTYNNDLKDKVGAKYEAHRKNSAPMPILAKLSFSSASGSGGSSGSSSHQKSGKEKKLLGSPLLHRTIFGHHQSHQTVPTAASYADADYDQEIFSQVVFPKVSSHYNENASSSVGGGGVYKVRNVSSSKAPDMEAPPPPTAVQSPTHSVNYPISSPSKATTPSSTLATPTPEYPDMECPPVFEPEIYSLTDANSSFLLRRSTNGSENNEEKC